MPYDMQTQVPKLESLLLSIIVELVDYAKLRRKLFPHVNDLNTTSHSNEDESTIFLKREDSIKYIWLYRGNLKVAKLFTTASRNQTSSGQCLISV